MIPACLPPREVSRPKVPPPPDACDTHAHVFVPSKRFPCADDRSYTPPDAALEKYLGRPDQIGFTRGVLVQGSAHGCDNSAMLDGLTRCPDRLRGVAVADADIAAAELHAWNRVGVRALRFNHWCGPIRSGWCGAATGRIRGSRAKCPMPDICSSCFRCGRRIAQPSTVFSRPIPPSSMVFPN